MAMVMGGRMPGGYLVVTLAVSVAPSPGLASGLLGLGRVVSSATACLSLSVRRTLYGPVITLSPSESPPRMMAWVRSLDPVVTGLATALPSTILYTTRAKVLFL